VPRTVTISLPADRAGALVGDLWELGGVLTLSRHRQASLLPAGDVVTVDLLDTSLSDLFSLLSRHGAGTDPSVSVTTSEPSAIVSASSSAELAHEPATAALEEVEPMLEKQSTMRANKVVAMTAAGAVATVGLLTNSVHLVVGAMVLAPGFESFLKVAFRSAGRGRSFRRGFADIGIGWGALVLGAAAAAIVLRGLGIEPTETAGGYLQAGSLVAYWREVTAAATVVALIGGVAGAVLIMATRPVLTAGVMIALALVPGAALVGIGAAGGDARLAADGALRWAHDALIVTGVGALVFWSYRLRRGRSLGTTAAAGP
jgi:hypothetical protein